MKPPIRPRPPSNPSPESDGSGEHDRGDGQGAQSSFPPVVERKRISSSGKSTSLQDSGRVFDLGESSADRFDPSVRGRGVESSGRSGGLAQLGGSSLAKIAVLSTGVAERLAERRAIERHDRARRGWITVVSLLLLFVAVWLFGFSSVFALQTSQVRISGVEKYVTEREVLDALAPFEGTALARLNMNDVHKAITSVPNVKSAVQTRRWPKGVTITVVERDPVAAVPVGKKYALLDISAVQVAQVDKAPKELPIIEIPLNGKNQVTLTTVLEVLHAVPLSLLGEIKSITATSQDDIEFVLRDGLNVQWGNSEQTDLKVKVLEVLRKKASDQGKHTIDLSAPTFPIIR